MSDSKQRIRRSQSSSRAKPQIASVPIKAIAADVGISTNLARRKLRRRGFSPNAAADGRWLFTPDQAEEVIEILARGVRFPRGK